MLIDALDHGEEDFERRRLAEARVEAERLLLATDKALAADADLLDPTEQREVPEHAARLRRALDEQEAPDAAAAVASRLQALSQVLDAATHAWAGRRMDRAFQGALAGRDVSQVAGSVEHARGVDAHLAEHQKGGAP